MLSNTARPRMVPERGVELRCRRSPSCRVRVHSVSSASRTRTGFGVVARRRRARRTGTGAGSAGSRPRRRRRRSGSDRARRSWSSSVAPVWPPATRLPASTLRSEMRPAIGARTSVHSRLSSAVLAGRPRPPAAGRCATLRLALRWSKSRSVMARDLTSGCGALDLGLRRVRPAPWCARPRPAALSTASLERPLVDGEQQVADLDDLAVRKCSLSMKPETRARTSTDATASKRPEYSSHCVMRLASGSATPTGIAGGPPWAKAGVATPKVRAAARTAGEKWTTVTPLANRSASRTRDVVAPGGAFNCQ